MDESAPRSSVWFFLINYILMAKNGHLATSSCKKVWQNEYFSFLFFQAEKGKDKEG